MLSAAASGDTLGAIAEKVGLKQPTVSYYLTKFRRGNPPLLELDHAQTRVEQLRHNSPRVRAWRATRAGRLALMEQAGIDPRNSASRGGEGHVRTDAIEVHNVRMKVAVHTNGIKWWPRAPVKLRNGVERFIHEGFHGVYLEMTAHNGRPLHYLLIAGAGGLSFDEAWGRAVQRLSAAYEELRKPAPTGYGSVMGTPLVVWDWGPGKSKVGAMHLSLTQALAAPPSLDGTPGCEIHPGEQVFHAAPATAQAVAEIGENSHAAAEASRTTQAVAVDISTQAAAIEVATNDVKAAVAEYVAHAKAQQQGAAVREEGLVQALRGIEQILRAIMPSQNGYPPLPPDDRIEVA